MTIRFFIIFILSVLLNFNSLSQNPYKYSFDGSLSFGRLLAHRNSMRRMVDKNSYSAEITFNLHTNGVKHHHKEYNYPSYGFTINYSNPGNKTDIGNIICSYGFVSLPINKNKNPFHFKIGLGMGWVEKTFDLDNNFQSLAISTHLNANVQLKIERSFKLKNQHFLKGAILFNHLSNGSFQTPNLGLNLTQLQLSYSLGLKKQIADSTNLKNSIFKKQNLTIYNSSAFKENQTPTLKKYYINETCIQHQYRLGHKSGIISGFDILYNPSLEDFTNKRSQCGLFVGHLLHLDKLKIGLLMGTYFYNKKDKSETLYHKLFTEYHFTNKLSARLTLKSHWAKADFFSLGIGYKI